MTATASLYADAAVAAMMCKIRDWHPTTQCENSEKEEARRLRNLESDLFTSRVCEVPATQKEMFVVLQISLCDIFSLETSLTDRSMNRNHSASSLLRLPPEIRVRIYSLVLGGQRVWIYHNARRLKWRTPERTRLEAGQSVQPGQYFHRGGNLSHSTADPPISTEPLKHALHLGLLRVCRQIYTETALLPYALNTFTFKDDSVRRLFEKSARPGKKRVQKKAVGDYEIGYWDEFRVRNGSL